MEVNRSQYGHHLSPWIYLACIRLSVSVHIINGVTLRRCDLEGALGGDMWCEKKNIDRTQSFILHQSYIGDV